MRSHLIDRVRKAAPIVFKLPVNIFKPGYKRETIPELTRLLQFDSTSKRLTKLPPVLYPPSVRLKGRQGYETKLFQSPECFLVSKQHEQYLVFSKIFRQLMKSVLFGLASISSAEKAGGPATYGKQWGIKAITDIPFYGILLFGLMVSSKIVKSATH
jgi:hypothetical protein